MTMSKNNNFKLPDFLVLGGMRCGSTTLYNALKHHPGLFLPEQKELHFFDDRNDELGNDIEVYKRVFSTATNDQLCAEVTPDYLSCLQSFQGIKNTFHDLKCVVILREPIARAISHYRLSVAAGFEVLSIDDAFQQEKERLKNRNEIADIYHSYLERSQYLDGLQRYASVFGKRAIHVMFLEELNQDPYQSLNKLCEFLGINTFSHEQATKLTRPTNTSEGLLSMQHSQLFKLKNKVLRLLAPALSQQKPTQLALNDKSRQKLEAHFFEQNRLLSKWLERDLPW